MSERTAHTPAGSILYDESCAVKPDGSWFSREYWAERARQGATTGGRGAVLFVRDGERRWVIRHYRRGGLVGRFIDDAYQWLGAARTRSFAEWRLLALLHAEGFPVPRPVAARYVRSGLVYRADLIITEIEGAATLADRITAGPLSAGVWRAIGAVVARLHHRGVHHVDLNAHNVLIDAHDAVHVIDFDRARIRPPGTWRDTVLARLRRSLDKLCRQRDDVRFDEVDWQALMQGYGA